MYVLDCACSPTYLPFTNASKAWPRLATRSTGLISSLEFKSWGSNSILQSEYRKHVRFRLNTVSSNSLKFLLSRSQVLNLICIWLATVRKIYLLSGVPCIICRILQQTIELLWIFGINWQLLNGWDGFWGFFPFKIACNLWFLEVPCIMLCYNLFLHKRRILRHSSISKWYQYPNQETKSSSKRFFFFFPNSSHPLWYK